MDDFTDAFFPNVPSESEADNNTVEQTQEPETPQVTEPVEEPTETTPQVTEPEHRPRDEQGRFSEKRTAIPVEALLEERTKRQEWERKHQELQQQLTELQRSKEAEARPDPFENPEGMWAEVEKLADAKAQQAVEALKQQQVANWINQSGARAEAAGHSKESITAALQWAGGQNPEFKAQLHQQADPVSWILEQQNRHAQIQEFMRDPEAFKAKLLTEQSAAPVATSAGKQNTTAGKTASTKSVASMGSGTAPSPVSNESDEEFLKGVFSRRS